MAATVQSELHDQSWREAAACEGKPFRWFFPEVESPVSMNVRHARQVCASCPVKAECLAFALNTGGPGIYAGTTRRMRRALPEVAALLVQVQAQTTTGRFRSVGPEEWVA
jgi:WhiB family redox-sensing transcriptional regulator